VFLRPADELEEGIVDFWKWTHPAGAYASGFKDMAGQVRVPDPEATAAILNGLEALRDATDDPVHLGYMAYLRRTVLFDEPYMLPDEGLWAFYRHLVLEGMQAEPLGRLADSCIEALRVAKRNLAGREWPIEIRILTVNESNGFAGVVRTVREQCRNPELAERMDGLLGAIGDYQRPFAVEGIVEGDFSEAFPLMEAEGGDLGRSEVYPDLLKDRYGFYETPREIEEKALGWLKDDLAALRDLTEEVADAYGCDAQAETVAEEMAKRREVPKARVLEFIASLRQHLHRVMEDNLVRITPNYETRLMETPPYLLNFIPTAAMSTFGAFTDRPFNIFFTTTDEKRSPPSGSPDLFQVLVHEEYGHCVNYSNSASDFGAKPTMVELLKTNLSLPISDGISFHREREAMDLMAELVHGRDLSPAEKGLLRTLKALGDLDLWLKEMQFVVWEWRVMRDLRAIGDVRVNTGKQTLADFVHWGHEETELSRKMVYNQIVIFQAEVGYAPCYATAGNRIAEIQADAVKRGKDLVEFNTFASSMGFPPRPVFEERLEEWAAS
jgi:hypothetical protein